MKAPEKYLSTAVAFPGNYGTGELKLLSSNPSDYPLINPNFLAHQFDKRVAIESVRETMEFLNKPLMAESSLRFAAGPAGITDEDILLRANSENFLLDTRAALETHGEMEFASADEIYM